jgi:release factor glutamine methyltransferase
MADTDARDLLAEATRRLADAGVATPRVDAELLLGNLLRVPRSRLGLIDALTRKQADAFDAALARRAAREPLQHITGHAPFRHVELSVGPGVFVPRPETELLVDAVLPALRSALERRRDERPVAVDLCSGSGALAIALADEVPGIRVVALERAGPALPWLRRNAAGTTVEVLIGDITDPELLSEPRLAALVGHVDAVVCNPPYVPRGTPVDPEVRADPADAVFAGMDGLGLMPAAIAVAAELLRPGDGMLAIEHDESHGMAVPALLCADGRWTDVVDHADLTARPRYSTAVRARPGHQSSRR